MNLTYDTIQVGMHVRCNYTGVIWPDVYRLDKTAIVISFNYGGTVNIKWDDGYADSDAWSGACYFDEILGGRKRKPKKVIPDIPLDPTLPILQAGYIQDRARKKFK